MKTVQQMIIELTEKGAVQARIAEKCGTSPCQVTNMKQGHDPSYTLGKKVEALYKSNARRKRVNF